MPPQWAVGLHQIDLIEVDMKLRQPVLTHEVRPISYQVVLDGYTSQVASVSSGVPQGSILRPQDSKTGGSTEVCCQVGH